MKPLNLLMFLLGLALAFVPLSYAIDCPSSCTYESGDWVAVKSVYATAEELNYPTSTAPYPCESRTSGFDIYKTEFLWMNGDEHVYRLYSSFQNPVCIGTASNGVMDDGEDGIDCGGLTGVDCVDGCPSDYVFFTEDGETVCQKGTDADSYGNCPTGYNFIPPDYCTVSIPTTPVSPDIDTSILPAPTTDIFEGGTFSTYTDTSTSDPVDNGDGTSTTITTTTTTGSDGSSTSTTTSTTTDNTTGDIVGVSTTTTGTTSPEENPENYDFGGSAAGDFDGMTLSADDLPVEDDYQEWFNSAVSSNPVVAAIESMSVQTSSPVCSISGQVLGTTVEFSMCGSLYTDTFSMMGNVLVFLAGVFGYFIIVGRD